MVKDTVLAARDLRAVSAINYQLYVEEMNQKLNEIIVALGESLDEKIKNNYNLIHKPEMDMIKDEDRRKLNNILSEADQFSAILCTAGDRTANTLLTRCFNQLRNAINPKYPLNFPSYEKVMMYTNKTIDALKVAVSRHAQNNYGLNERIQENAFGSQAIVGEPQVIHPKLKNSYKKGYNVQED